MLEQIKLDKILFLDIETVPQFKTFDEAPEKIQKLWAKKWVADTKSTWTKEVWNNWNNKKAA